MRRILRLGIYHLHQAQESSKTQEAAAHEARKVQQCCSPIILLGLDCPRLSLSCDLNCRLVLAAIQSFHLISPLISVSLAACLLTTVLFIADGAWFFAYAFFFCFAPEQVQLGWTLRCTTYTTSDCITHFALSLMYHNLFFLQFSSGTCTLRDRHYCSTFMASCNECPVTGVDQCTLAVLNIITFSGRRYIQV